MSKDSDNTTPVVPAADAVNPDGYSPEQRTALLTRMFSSIRQDVGAINRTIVARETPEGFLISHEEAAIVSAKLMRASTAVAALEKIFGSALPAGADLSVIENETMELVQAASPKSILESFDRATAKLSSRNKSDPTTLVHQG